MTRFRTTARTLLGRLTGGRRTSRPEAERPAGPPKGRGSPGADPVAVDVARELVRAALAAGLPEGWAAAWHSGSLAPPAVAEVAQHGWPELAPGHWTIGRYRPRPPSERTHEHEVVWLDPDDYFELAIATHGEALLILHDNSEIASLPGQKLGFTADFVPIADLDVMRLAEALDYAVRTYRPDERNARPTPEAVILPAVALQRGTGPLWTELTGSDFVQWFHLREVAREPACDGDLVRFRPTGMPNAAEVRLTLRPSQRVDEAVLSLDRDWMGSGRIDPDAIDIAKSFARELGRGVPEMERLATAIEQLLTTHSAKPVLFAAAGSTPLPPGAVPAGDVGPLVRAFLHADVGEAELQAPEGWSLAVRNATEQGRARLLIELRFRLEPL